MLFLAVAAPLLCGCLLGEVGLTGRVTNDNNTPLAGARVILTTPESVSMEATSDLTGAFKFQDRMAGEYRIAVEREGYFRVPAKPVRLEEGANEITLILAPRREVFEAIDVSATAAAVNLERTAPEYTVSGAEILKIPFPSSNNLKNAMRTMPGIVQDVKGGVHLNGSAEEQVLYTLNGFTLNDPLTNRFETRLSVESVQSVDVMSGQLSAEFGKGAAGMIAINPNAGDDKIRYSATNFFPGIETRKGIFLGNWSPRASLSGPIRKGRAWFSDSVSLQYDKNVIEELPKGADSMTSWRMGNLLHTQMNLSPSHILYGGLLTNIWWAPRTGLSVLNSPESTIDRRTRQWFFNVKDQLYLSRGTLLEVGYAANRTFGREIPQGHGFLRMTPDGNTGFAYVDAARKAGRDQVLANLALPAVQWKGSHQLKVGMDLDRLTYWQEARRTGLEQFRSDGTPVRRMWYAGPSELGRSNFEVAFYVHEAWKVRPGLMIEAGVRSDWDRILRSWNASPRVGVAWAPFGHMRTKVSAGFGVVHEATNLRLFTRPLDQFSLSDYYGRDGEVARGPAASVFVFGSSRPASPRTLNWSAGFEHEFSDSLYLRTGYMRRRAGRGFTYANELQPDQLPPPDVVRNAGTTVFDAVYALGNGRRDAFDSFEITVKKTLRKEYGLMASYIRSSARSNGVVDINIDDPIVVLRNVGPMPWDSPNRFIGWGYLPLFRKNWALAYFLETRDGFPFSVQSSDGRTVGDVNSHRFPAFFELNLHVERRFVARGYRWELRMGCNNITNHKNPNVVNGNEDSANFMRFYGGQTRSMNVRLRWLGKVTR